MASKKKVAKKKVAKKKASKKKVAKKTAAAQPVEETKRASTVLEHAQNSVDSFIDAYGTVRTHRGAGQRAPSNAEQDLIRAALVFAAAGLDSTIKELIRGSLRKLAAIDDDVRSGLAEFVKKRLTKDQEAAGKAKHQLLANLMINPDPTDTLIDEYIIELTGSSLQSVDELFRAASALDVEILELKNDKDELVEAFKIRNKIIHELDVRFGAGRGQRKRNDRRQADLEASSNQLLDVGRSFIIAVKKKLASN